MDPIIALARRLLFAERPAPDVPEAATTTTSERLAKFARGVRANAVAVA